MSEFPWNLPEQWRPELPVNRQLLAERYKKLIAHFQNKHPDKREISSVVSQDPSELTMLERGALYQELLRVFGLGSDSGLQPSGVPLNPAPAAGGSEIALPIPPAEDN